MANPSENDSRNDLFASVLLKSIAFAFGAGVGGLIGYFFLPQFVQAFFGNAPNLPLYCALGAALVGGLSTYRNAATQLRRQAKTREVAEELGMDYSSDAGDELEESARELFAGFGPVAFENVVRKEVESTQMLVADLVRRERNRNSSGSHSRTTRRTIAYFEADHLWWPDFALQPEGMLLNVFSKVVGVQDIDIPEAPEFSKNYHLSGRYPDEARRFFDRPQLLHYFAKHPGLEIRASGNRMALGAGKQCQPEELEPFIQQAMHLFTLLMEASDEFKAERRSQPQAGRETGAIPQQFTGIAGALVRGRTVTSDQLQAFLSEFPPRQIPKNIRRQRVGSGSLIASALGLIFTLAGSVFAVYSAFFAEGPWNDERIVPLVFAIVFPAVGLPLLLLAWRYRHINKRLLRHGRVAQGEILNVERTSVTVNDQPQYRLRIRFDTETGQAEGTCHVYGQHGRDARRTAELAEGVRVLYDPKKPSRMLWAESLLADPNAAFSPVR